MKRDNSRRYPVMAGLVWGFLSSWNFAFFRPPRCLAWGWREGRLPALRFLGKRDMSMAGPLSRSKPPEAGAEGQPLQGSSHRRPSAAEIAGTSSRRSIRLARRRNRGLALLTCLSSTLRMDVGEYATHVFPWRGAGARL